MASPSQKERIDALEKEVARLRELVESQSKPKDWLDTVWGSFANDPIYDDAMRLGRKWRESYRSAQRFATKVRARSKCSLEDHGHGY